MASSDLRDCLLGMNKVYVNVKQLMHYLTQVMVISRLAYLPSQLNCVMYFAEWTHRLDSWTGLTNFTANSLSKKNETLLTDYTPHITS